MIQMIGVKACTVLPPLILMPIINDSLMTPSRIGSILYGASSSSIHLIPIVIIDRPHILDTRAYQLHNVGGYKVLSATESSIRCRLFLTLEDFV